MKIANSDYWRLIDEITKEKLPWEKWKNCRVLISGATGMMGKCFIDAIMRRNEQFGDNIRIIALSRNAEFAVQRFEEYWDAPCFEYHACDVNSMLQDVGEVDYIIHAASNTHPLQYSNDSIGTITSNIIGTKNLLDYAVSHGTKKFCFVSSVEVYGENRGDVERFDEEYMGYIDCNTLRAGYPESKRVGEALCNAYKQTFGLDFCTARLSRVYGPTMLLTDSKAISQFIKKAAMKEDIVLKSAGTQKYSYTFVTDAVAGVLYTMLMGESGEAYNVSDEKSEITLKEIAALLADNAGTKVVFEMPDESEQQGYSKATKAMLDTAKLRELGWKPQVHMAEGLKCTVEEVGAALKCS